MNRESGFYWVKFSDDLDWEVAEWLSEFKHASYWLRAGTERIYNDFEFLEIDENRIIRSE